ncbi:MAG TPA: aspartate--tRNA ligase [Dehalococcoidia bacterium]|nr:aspartate--tRNA ligase [Dehalococcoidia bacterium]
MLKSHNCGQLRASDEGQDVTLAGWVHRRRDHGGLIFIDLRDHDGLTQVVFNPKDAAGAYAVADTVRGEYVLQVEGSVSRRPKGTENAHLPTGEIEVKARAATVLNEAKTPPFYIVEETDVDELLRLKYRYLDLRRETIHRNIVLRARVTKFIRDYLTERGFTEIETPILTAPTPEGARDYLVPSRVHAGRFYALPQSPQQMKQLLMVAGFERYFQIAHCLRDEDLRADRQPEHTQLDLEMSFVSDEEDILGLLEGLYYALVQTVTPHFKVQAHPFPRMTYEESVRRFGVDKPDLRYGLELVDLTDALRESEFAIFRQTVAAGGVVRALCVSGGAEFSRKQTDDLTTFVQQYGAKGLVSLAFLGEGPIDSLSQDDIRSPVAKYFSVEQAREMARLAGATRGDILLMVADQAGVANKALDGLRREVAARLELADPGTLAFAFVTEYPMFEWSETEERWMSSHHPFTSPRAEDIPLMDSDPARVRSHAYDLVCNGWELFSGSIRIHRREVQEKAFGMLGIGPEEARRRFGHMLEAFEYGAPPHAGIGAGIDRLMAVLTGQPDIREVIAFPKTKSATDPLTGAPGEVSEEQLRELHIAVTEKEEGTS